MAFVKIIWVLFGLFFIVGCDSSVQIPKQPKNVPKEAVWAGGPDGGSWFLCRGIANKLTYYKCSIYSDYDGAVLAQGTFVLRAVTWDAERKQPNYHVTKPVEELAFRFYDDRIHLNDSLILLPHGVIDYPFGDGHGKKQRYESGEPVGSETEY